MEVVKTRNAIKDHAVISKERPGQIFPSHVAGTSDEVKATLPKKDSVKRALRYTQRGNVSVDPKSLKDFTVEGDFSLTSGGQRFLLHDSGCEAVKRVLVFASDEGLRHLASEQSWYMDGTFKMLPKSFQPAVCDTCKAFHQCSYMLLCSSPRQDRRELQGNAQSPT